MANTMMLMPDTVEEFMEQYKVVDTEQIYTNGAELVPIFRMKQWFISHPCEPQRWIPADVVRCKNCKHADLFYPYCTIWEAAIDGDGYCYKGEKE